jgi:hypothetical protein
MRKAVLAVTLLVAIGCEGALWAQQQAVFPNTMETPMLVDQPTAAILPRGSFTAGLRAFPAGGLLARISVGLSDRLNFGASFGGANIIGAGEVDWNPHPGIHLAYRFFEETYAMPDIVVGYESQGYGPYITESERYTVKSKGFYIVASKRYGAPLSFGGHVGINYSQEDKDGDKDPDLFAGLNLSVNEEIALVADYAVGMNDNDANGLGNGDGYLNVGIRWIFAQRLFVEFAFKDILENRKDLKLANRELKIGYLEYFY